MGLLFLTKHLYGCHDLNRNSSSKSQENVWKKTGASSQNSSPLICSHVNFCFFKEKALLLNPPFEDLCYVFFDLEILIQWFSWRSLSLVGKTPFGFRRWYIYNHPGADRIYSACKYTHILVLYTYKYIYHTRIYSYTCTFDDSVPFPLILQFYIFKTRWWMLQLFITISHL